MRGKVGLLLLLRSRSWITPAYAGKSFIVRCSALEVKDHPRICGEKFNALPAELKAKGSPPHMRGKVGLKETQSSASRITPAYAGKRREEHSGQRGEQDHPRICGEKSQGHGQRQPSGRITPAYAGKSFDVASFRPRPLDHPRICGEKLMHRGPVLVPLGSPPHMRGKGTSSASTTALFRITPAYAGKRLGTAADRIDGGDHPRICGEKGGRVIF